MTSKKALQELMNGFGFGVIGRNLCEIIKQDLNRLEDLEDNHEVVLNTLEDATNQLEKYKNAIEILNRFVALTKGRNEKTNKWDIPFIYSLGLSKKITQQEYDLLEEVLENDK